MKIINLTQHPATDEQRASGVVDLPPSVRADAIKLMTFDTLPTRNEVVAVAEFLVNMAIAENADAAMIGGAPFLMHDLHEQLTIAGILPVYAFSVRESIEETLPDGAIRKVNIFRHQGFVS